MTAQTRSGADGAPAPSASAAPTAPTARTAPARPASSGAHTAQGGPAPKATAQPGRAPASDLHVEIVTREYPPAVYGGAGVHVAELVKVLRKRAHVHVRCFGEPRTEPGVTAYPEGDPAQAGNAALAVFGTDLQIAGAAQHADIVHSHTWYANLAGHLAALLGGVPHVLTAHSLEPLRPWKAEQLGGGYRLSRWAERTAYQAAARVIAVSAGMRRDILRVYPEVDPDKVVVVHNGIDVDAWHPYRGEAADKVLDLYGIDPGRPTVVFVGRQTRQKGLPYLLRAAARLEPEVQIVLCAGAPDTPEIEAEVKELVGRLRAARGSGVVFIDQMLPHLALMAILTAATVFVCPSIYEPLGIVNLEAMACGVPVVGTATGGIPEVVAAGETGWLVPIEQAQDGTGTPVDPARYVTDLCGVLGEALSDPARAERFGAAARRRAEEHFSWETIADRTMAVYRAALAA